MIGQRIGLLAECVTYSVNNWPSSLTVTPRSVFSTVNVAAGRNGARKQVRAARIRAVSRTGRCIGETRVALDNRLIIDGGRPQSQHLSPAQRHLSCNLSKTHAA